MYNLKIIVYKYICEVYMSIPSLMPTSSPSFSSTNYTCVFLNKNTQRTAHRIVIFGGTIGIIMLIASSVLAQLSLLIAGVCTVSLALLSAYIIKERSMKNAMEDMKLYIDPIQQYLQSIGEKVEAQAKKIQKLEEELQKRELPIIVEHPISDTNKGFTDTCQHRSTLEETPLMAASASAASSAQPLDQSTVLPSASAATSQSEPPKKTGWFSSFGKK